MMKAMESKRMELNDKRLDAVCGGFFAELICEGIEYLADHIKDTIEEYCGDRTAVPPVVPGFNVY